MATTELQRAFGQRVRELRDAQEWSQERLAQEAGVNRTYLGDVERGERNLAIENLARLAGAFQLSLSELFDDPRFGRRLTMRTARAARDHAAHRN
jgi:transcriptional regulator with XRE-family HTH domain